jgi:KUP system potassium uptake protein
MGSHSSSHKLSIAGVFITMGIIFGDIGTSPIYVMTAIVHGHILTKELVYGGLSAVFWTLLFITTFKYVYLALNADNRGEGGIFALYALVKRFKAKWVIFPALIGCGALIADGFITPPISISSAIEGLELLNPNIPTFQIVICIITGIFMFQQFGTKVVGAIFGPIMFIWFTMIGALGVLQIIKHPEIIEALNPMYALNLVLNTKGGFLFLGAVFLCTTGGEALYSDLGHCGKQNIRVSWMFVKAMLVLNYFGQGAFLIENFGTKWGENKIFYAMMPEKFLPFGILVASFATIIASQALISGVFSLVNEAMKLKLWPNFKVLYPSESQGQIYIPFINWLLFAGCIAVQCIFRESGRMEAAYGLAITLNMLMTTTLLTYLFITKRKPLFIVIPFTLFFLTIEGAFFISNMNKFMHGGWFAVLIAAILFVYMAIYHFARKLRNKHVEFSEIKQYIPVIRDLQQDTSIPKEATNLVYLAMANDKYHIDSNIIYSILRKKPKRADVYWFVHVDITNEPYGASYMVNTIIPKHMFFVKLKFGFKVEHKVNSMFNKIVEEMTANGEIDPLSQYPSLRKHELPADFKFIVLNSHVSVDNNLNGFEQFLTKGFSVIKKFSLSTAEDFGMERTNIEVETVPIYVKNTTKINLERVEPKN